MTPVFHFEDYTVRPVEERDRVFLDTLIENDDYHRGRMDADFFLKLKPGEDAWALEDERGNIVFYFKTSTAIRISIQFGDQSTLAAKRRNGTALMKGLQWLQGRLAQNRFRQIFFDTVCPELHVFAKRHLGFVDEPGLLGMAVDMPRVEKMQPRAEGSLPKDGLERVG